jgi:hypothetical protein
MWIRIRIRKTAYNYSMTFQVALETLEGHQRAIMGSMTVEASTIFFIEKCCNTKSAMFFMDGLEFGSMVLLTIYLIRITYIDI